MSGSGRRVAPPKRRAVRYLVRHSAAGGGHRWYWIPPSKLRRLPERPPWLNATALGRDVAVAVSEAEKLNARLDAWRGRRGRAAPAGMEALISAYLQHSAFTGKSERTRADYEQHLLAIRRDLAGADPADVTPLVLDTYREKLQREGALGLRQLAYRFQVLRLLFAWAKRTGRFSGDNPAAALKLKLPAPRAKKVWKLANLRALTAAEPYPVGLAARIALYTLQRQGDILDMRWSDYDGRFITLATNKTGVDLIVPVHPRLAAALDAAPRRGEFIIATGGGRRYTEGGFRALWRTALDRAAIPRPRRTFHDIRGTAISELSGAKVSDQTVMRFTGHRRKGEGAILDVYDARLGEMAADAFPVMDRWQV